MKRAILGTVLGMVSIVGLAIVVGAQGPPPDFGGPMGGMFAFDGLMGGFGGKVVTGKPVSATITITHSESLPGNTISNTSSGTLARGVDGSTYRHMKFASLGPWAASGNGREFAYIRNLTQGVQYFVNVAKGTYHSSGFEPRSPREKSGKHPRDGSTETLSDNPNATYTDPATNTVYPVDDQKVTRTIPAGAIGNQLPIVITTERWYSNTLELLLEETRSDPRLGSTTYQLSNIGQSPSSSLFVPDPSFTQVEGKVGRGGPGKEPPPPAQD